jgi:hypothetical protein
MYNGPGPYEHYKGGKYHVLFPAIHTETAEVMVVYSDDTQAWVRPLNHFNEMVKTEGGCVPRFQRL